MPSYPEVMFALQIKAVFKDRPHIVTGMKREYRAVEGRRWRIDFAWPDQSVAVEIEGGTYTQGRHVRPKGFEADCEKYNALIEQGWRLFRFTPAMVKSGRAMEQMERIFAKST